MAYKSANVTFDERAVHGPAKSVAAIDAAKDALADGPDKQSVA
jgi:hypothetical protein